MEKTVENRLGKKTMESRSWKSSASKRWMCSPTAAMTKVMLNKVSKSKP